MPKNTTGGNKAKKGKNSGQRVERPLILADNSGEQCYGIIETFSGGNASVKYVRPIKNTAQQPQQQQYETITAIGFIRKNLRKWCKKFLRGDIILVCEREFETGKVDIVHKYNDDEIRALKRLPQVYSKIQPLIDAFSHNNNSQGSTNKTGGKLEVGDGIEFDENYSGTDDEDTNTSDSEASNTNDEIQKMKDMNAEYSSERQGGYKSYNSRQRVDNTKYAANKPKKKTGGQPIPAQQGTREMPPSDSEPDDIDLI